MNENQAALDAFILAVRAGYRIELYDSHVAVDHAERVLIISNSVCPVVVESVRRARVRLEHDLGGEG